MTQKPLFAIFCADHHILTGTKKIQSNTKSRPTGTALKSKKRLMLVELSGQEILKCSKRVDAHQPLDLFRQLKGHQNTF